jgi:hypothetical protein
MDEITKNNLYCLLLAIPILIIGVIDWQILKKRLSSYNHVLIFLIAHGFLSYIYTVLLISTISDFTNNKNLSWGIYGLSLLSLLFILLIFGALVLSAIINLIRRYVLKS